MDFVLILAITSDLLFASIACGADGIRIPPHSCAMIAAVSSGFLMVSALFGDFLCAGLSPGMLRRVGCTALCAIGVFQIIGVDVCAALVRTPCKYLRPLRRLASLMQDQTRADADGNKTLCAAEAFLLSLPLSIDSLVSGLGLNASGGALALCFAAAFCLSYAAARCGSRFARMLPLPSDTIRAWICGIILILLGMCKLI